MRPLIDSLGEPPNWVEDNSYVGKDWPSLARSAVVLKQARAASRRCDGSHVCRFAALQIVDRLFTKTLLASTSSN